MSFGIYLYRQDVSGLVEADRQAVLAALTRWGWDGSEESPYRIGTSDGLIAEFWAKELRSSEPFYGGNLEVRGFSTKLCHLILDLAQAGPFSVSHDGDSSTVILVSESQQTELPSDMVDYPKLMVYLTPEELDAALEGGFDEHFDMQQK
jgi:hypothetical protein